MRVTAHLHLRGPARPRPLLIACGALLGALGPLPPSRARFAAQSASAGATSARPGRRCGPAAASAAAFARELARLRRRLAVPGVVAAVVQDGAVCWRGTFADSAATPPLTPATPIRIASVTKAFTAVLVAQAVERGELRLDDPVRTRVPTFAGPPAVTVRYLLTHTSEGVPGAEYVYSSTRFGLLRPVLERATGRPFEALLRERVLGPAGMAWHPSPELGAHGGLVTTLDDLARFAAALDSGRLLRPATLRMLATPVASTSGAPLPMGLGWFAQRAQGVDVAWSYGQDDPDVSSALLLRVPDRGLTLVVLGTTDALSNPFRLLLGDVRASPVAAAFLRTWARPPGGAPVPPPDWTAWGADSARVARGLAGMEARTGHRYRDELVGEALLRLWGGDARGAAALVAAGVARYPALATAPDPVLLFLAGALAREPGADAARAVGLRTGPALLGAHPHNRWVLLALGALYTGAGRGDDAVPVYERLLALRDQEPDFLHRLFTAWGATALARHWRTRDPGRARAYVERALATKVGGGSEADARALLDSLGTAR